MTDQTMTDMTYKQFRAKFTELSWATVNGSYDKVNELLNCSDCNLSKDRHGISPYIYAYVMGDDAIVELLNAADCVPETHELEKANNVVKQLEVFVDIELEHSNSTYRDSEGKSVLSNECIDGNLFYILAAARYNVTYTCKLGKSPLIYASENGHTLIVEELLRRGYNRLSDNSGQGPLHYAERAGYTCITAALKRI